MTEIAKYPIVIGVILFLWGLFDPGDVIKGYVNQASIMQIGSLSILFGLSNYIYTLKKKNKEKQIKKVNSHIFKTGLFLCAWGFFDPYNIIKGYANEAALLLIGGLFILFNYGSKCYILSKKNKEKEIRKNTLIMITAGVIIFLAGLLAPYTINTKKIDSNRYKSTKIIITIANNKTAAYRKEAALIQLGGIAVLFGLIIRIYGFNSENQS